MRSDFPLPLMELRYDNGSGDAKCGEAIEYHCADLDFRNLPFEVARCQALTK